MHKIVFLSILLVCNIEFCFGQLASKVDERIELTGVVFRLAGFPEYTQGEIEEYNNDIDIHFYDYHNHDIIQYVIKLRLDNGLMYAGVTGSAMFITIDNGKVILNPDAPVAKLPGLGAQWPEGAFERYVELLNDFYQKSNFRKFFDDHQQLYKEVEEGMNHVLAGFNAGWFSDFFGVPFQAPCVYVALNNGRHNYYLMDYEKEAGYGIAMGGRRKYNFESIFPGIIHEISHNYSDPLFYTYWSQMESSADKIYGYIEEDMWNNAYGSASTSVLEWQNNLCTIMYFRDNFPLLGVYFMSQMRDRGFIWLPRSVQFMENFYANRDKYPHIYSFMPQLVEFFKYTSNDFKMVKYEFESRHPHVVNVFPANGSNIRNVDFNEIKITFSQPMSPDCYRIQIVKDDPSVTVIPQSDSINAYWADSLTFAIPIERSLIEKGKNYRVELKRNGFTTRDYNYIEQDYIINYNTQENENF